MTGPQAATPPSGLGDVPPFPAFPALPPFPSPAAPLSPPSIGSWPWPGFPSSQADNATTATTPIPPATDCHAELARTFVFASFIVSSPGPALPTCQTNAVEGPQRLPMCVGAPHKQGGCVSFGEAAAGYTNQELPGAIKRREVAGSPGDGVDVDRPVQLLPVEISTPSWESGAALAGTVTVIVFQAFAVSDEMARQLPVHVQLPEAPWSTNGWSDERPLPAGIQMWNVTALPGPAAGDDTATVPLPAPATLTASERAPAKARVVDVAAAVSGAPEIAQPWTPDSKLYCADCRRAASRPPYRPRRRRHLPVAPPLRRPRRPCPRAAARYRQRDAAGVQERARAALHEQLAVGVRVVLVRALPARARAEQQGDHARVGELRQVRGAVAEEVLGAVVLVARARAAVVARR